MRWLIPLSCLLLFTMSLIAQPIWVVTNTADGGEGSLRDALDKAGNTPGSDTIVFDIPQSDTGYDSVSGVWSIESTSTLSVSNNTVVFGAPAFGSDTLQEPGIRIHGTDSSLVLGRTGLRISDSVVLRLLIIDGFQYGIWIQSSSFIIESCYIGTGPHGIMAMPNGNAGILVADGANNGIIRNCLISGNLGHGIRLFGADTRGNIITNNLIGTTGSGSVALPNRTGIRLHAGANHNQITGNLISGHLQEGISVFDTGTDANVIEDNLIGLSGDESSMLPNGTFGVVIFNGPAQNRIGPGNRVAFNMQDGVLVDGADSTATVGNLITANAIFDNGENGIDNIRGGNTELQPPVIDSIRGKMVYGTSGPEQAVEFFLDGNDEGCCYTGSVKSDLTGQFTWSLPDNLPGMPFLTATATDTAGNTSEFSAPFCVEVVEVAIAGVAGFCEGMSTILDPGTYASYLWTTGQTTPTISVDSAGTYAVLVTDTRGCKGTDTVFISEYAAPFVQIEQSDTGCAITVLQVGAFDEYLWSTGDTTSMITVTSAGSYTVMVADDNGCTSADTALVTDDPLLIPWVQDLINNPFNPYCDECLTLSLAYWLDTPVLIYDWEASACNFTDIGFTTIYNCMGDTIQHCNLTIAGEICEPDAMINPDDLGERQVLWRCTQQVLPTCPPAPADILSLSWLVDTLAKYESLCDATCIEGNAGNFLYRHMIDGNVILELRTTCGDIIRRFYDCEGTLIYSCFDFNFGMPTCNLPFLPSSESGELIWECPGTTNSTSFSPVRAYKVYPTITSDHLTIETTEQNFWRIAVYDAYGRSLYQKPANTSIVELDVHTWPPGFLYIQIISNTGMQLEKVLKIE